MKHRCYEKNMGTSIKKSHPKCGHQVANVDIIDRFRSIILLPYKIMNYTIYLGPELHLSELEENSH